MMLSMLAHSSYHQHLTQGWAAFELGNLEKAEQHFHELLNNEDDPHIETVDLIEAHNGMGMVALLHRDLFDANRWFRESQYMLEKYFHGVFPSKIRWEQEDERAYARMLCGSGHVYYAQGDTKKAAKAYVSVHELDSKDTLGVAEFREGIKRKRSFDEFMPHGWCEVPTIDSKAKA